MTTAAVVNSLFIVVVVENAVFDFSVQIVGQHAH